MADIGRLSRCYWQSSAGRDGTSKSFIIDHLVGAYCPMVAQESSLSQGEKAVRVRRFTDQITQLVYSLESGLDIIINVPLTPDRRCAQQDGAG